MIFPRSYHNHTSVKRGFHDEENAPVTESRIGRRGAESHLNFRPSDLSPGSMGPVNCPHAGRPFCVQRRIPMKLKVPREHNGS